MCSGCKRVWSFLHVLWSVLYVTSGAAQLVAGIFFLLAIPSLILGCNLITGLWNICMGIGVGMVACCAHVTARRQEYLLYMIISILMCNVANTLLTEWGFYVEDLGKLLQKHHYHVLVQYASISTRIAAVVVIVGTLVDSQLTFCSMQALRSATASSSATTVTNNNKKKKVRTSHEQVSDIEYIIPRPKSSSGTSKQQQVYDAYNTQSWVFDADHTPHPGGGGGGGCRRIAESPDGNHYSRRMKKGDLANGGVALVADTTYLIDEHHTPVASDDSASNSDRKLGYMKSFSRSTSPAVLSASSSQLSLGGTQYASLMNELQKAIGGKRAAADSEAQCSSSSDADFSKELEAALQLIQDLESPNTIDESDDDDEKMLAAESAMKPSTGKGARIVVQCSDSQSTSGYSSPTHNKSGAPTCWSTTSSLDGHGLAYTIHNTRSTAVISLFAPVGGDALKKGKSVTLVNISGDEPTDLPIAAVTENELAKTTTGSSWNVKSLLRRKKQSALPKLCPELEAAIVKSESLAYLSELELLARHQRNKDIQRQIEQRVQQQLGTPWNDND